MRVVRAVAVLHRMYFILTFRGVFFFQLSCDSQYCWYNAVVELQQFTTFFYAELEGGRERRPSEEVWSEESGSAASKSGENLD